MKFLGVTILQGVEFSIFLLILNEPYNSAALHALPVINERTKSYITNYALDIHV